MLEINDLLMPHFLLLRHVKIVCVCEARERNEVLIMAQQYRRWWSERKIKISCIYANDFLTRVARSKFIIASPHNKPKRRRKSPHHQRDTRSTMRMMCEEKKFSTHVIFQRLFPFSDLFLRLHSPVGVITYPFHKSMFFRS